MRVSPWIVPDGLWLRIEPLLPTRPRRFRYPGRRPLDDRLVLQGILFVLHTGSVGSIWPQELGFGCGMTAWRRLRDWQQADVWDRLHELLLAELHAAGEIAWSRAVADSSHVQAKKGAPKRVPARVERGRLGSKHHLLVDAGGLPLAWTLTGGNRNDVTQLLALLDRVPPVRGRPRRPKRRPKRLLADRGYDQDKYRRLVRERGITPLIAAATPRTEPGSAANAGSSSAPSPGCTTAADSCSAPTAATTSTRRTSVGAPRNVTPAIPSATHPTGVSRSPGASASSVAAKTW